MDMVHMRQKNEGSARIPKELRGERMCMCSEARKSDREEVRGANSRKRKRSRKSHPWYRLER